jgi:hypothetical protein
MKTILVAALAISTVAVTAASAQTNRQQQSRTPASYTVIEQGQVRGADPDPWVRFELLREVDPANAG